MKNIKYIFIVAIAITLVWLFFPKSCGNKLETLENKKDKSLIIDSIISAQTEKHNRELDSVIQIQYKKDSIAEIKANSLTADRNRLLAIVRGFHGVRVDSINQTVNDIPIAVYEAEMNANLICDTLLQFKDVQISIRDSIILMREIQRFNDRNEIVTKNHAIQDLIALDNQKEKKVKHAKSLNKKIPGIAVICTAAGFILATFVLK